MAGHPRDAVILQGFDENATLCYEQQLSLSDVPASRYLWEDSSFIRSHGIRKLIGEIYGSTGALEQSYERHYGAAGTYQGGQIKFADGRCLTTNTSGLEPSVILEQDLIFTVHYADSILRRIPLPRAGSRSRWLCTTRMGGSTPPSISSFLPISSHPGLTAQAKRTSRRTRT